MKRTFRFTMELCPKIIASEAPASIHEFSKHFLLHFCACAFYPVEKYSTMAGPVVQGIDTLASAMKGNIIPDQEYLLQGSLLDSHIEVFKHRLRGLCDNTLGGEEQFSEREMVFSIRGTSAQPLSLRVRKTENIGGSSHMHRDSDTPWQLRYLGQGFEIIKTCILMISNNAFTGKLANEQPRCVLVTTSHVAKTQSSS